MNKLLKSIIEKLEECIELTNQERERDELPRLKKIEIKILGQFSLFADQEAASKLPLVATRDFDAMLVGDWSARSLLKIVLAEFNLEYDDLSKEIWIPKNAKYKKLYESSNLKVTYLRAIDTLISKAVKAPEKNERLLKAAIKLYPALTKEISKYKK